ncbi:MAG: ABC transporter ATP-binding protein [Bauldia sp.]|uniref:ABC transporter ATP-binding protein n=1 Tax=Bauldia sp. TaxID=2575872 RepID=UPI001D3379DD|nr:ABC transporter ATP-binding protein [Bauldia sp.]MCB1497515.1 ABC transporter ATP-binding protein [Bauldia sp.]
MTDPDAAERVLEVANARHRYGDVIGLDDVSLSVRRGEFLTLLGQSGSGKTTLLRIIGGLETPTSIAALRIGDEDVRGVPAARRDCSTVFQGYALFPHMSVSENVEFGLRVRGVAPAERRRKAVSALSLVRLSGKEDRRIHQLSGGERQRVGLARALVTEPTILLLDEPLGALDERLRIDMQVELLALQKQLGMTFIYVTHSQEEAITMSDRIALMHRGRIVQLAPPEDLFEKPVNRFVADFMGVENLIDGVIASGLEEGGHVELDAGTARFRARWTGVEEPEIGSGATLVVRAERPVMLSGSAAVGLNSVPASLGSTIYKGAHVDQIVTTPVGPMTVRVLDRHAVPASLSAVQVPPDAACIVPNRGDHSS